MLSTVARHTFPSLFPLVPVKLNEHCFKNTALSETPLKLSLPFSVRLLFSSDEFYVSFWLKHYRGAFRERLVWSNPTERWKKERCWLAFFQRCDTESWTEVRCYFSMHFMLFPQCFFAWPTHSNKTLEEIPSSCSTNEFAPWFHLCPPLACKIIISRSG